MRRVHFKSRFVGLPDLLLPAPSSDRLRESNPERKNRASLWMKSSSRSATT